MKAMSKHLYKNPAFSIMIHLNAYIVCFMFFLMFSWRHNDVYLIISLVLIGLIILSIIYSFFSWNIKINFDNEKIFYKYKGKTYSWRWDELTECAIKIRFAAGLNPLCYYFEIATNSNIKKLIFEYSKIREQFLLSVCPLEKVKIMFEKAFNN